MSCVVGVAYKRNRFIWLFLYCGPSTEAMGVAFGSEIGLRVMNLNTSLVRQSSTTYRG